MVRLVGASTRNRNRQLSNKYRLKVVHGDIEADPADLAEEDGGDVQYLVAGVDAEDANEHHLQEVLHASSQHVYSHRPTRGAPSNRHKTPQTHAFIPTPDSTGIAEHYSDLYAPNRWTDPVTYLCTSASPEESCNNALASNFTYYMDERDKEWLDKNNEAARGEGTSSQGAMSLSVTRISARNSKAKGKDSEHSLTLVISEDEFELVMGLFEKVTHEKTEYLHHGLENGMAFPLFSEYQDTFSFPLSPATFASYSAPQWIPTPSRLISVARTIYQYWKERRTERGGHRIIPILNFDESDALNESYVCFRRREIKTARKTRASQVTSSDKLIRLQAELLYPLELGKQLLQREELKRDSAMHCQQVWRKRIFLADFKRKFPSWGDKEDENLLIDKDKPKGVESTRPPKIKPDVVMGAPTRPEPITMRPAERIALINNAVEKILKRQKEEGRQWEDEVKDPYQMPPVPYSTRYFKYIPLPPASSDISQERSCRALRTRVGRGGRLLVDRKNTVIPSIVLVRRPLLLEAEVGQMDKDDEQLERLQERWRYDVDDVPAMGPDEDNRVLVDDYHPRFLRHSMTFLLDPDQQNLINDPAIPVINNERQQLVVPFRLGLPPVHRVISGPSRTPISTQQPFRAMAPAVVPQMCTSLNGSMRPSPVTPNMSDPPRLSQSSHPNSTTLVRHSPPSSGIRRAAINLPHTDLSSAEVAGRQSTLSDSLRIPQLLQHDTDSQQDLEASDGVVIPVRPQSITTNNLSNSATPRTSVAFSNSTQPGVQENHGLTVLQMQNLKAAFAQVQASQDTKGAIQVSPSYTQSGSVNFALHQQSVAVTSSNSDILSATRQMQWASGVLPSNKSPVSSDFGSQIPGLLSPSAVQVISVPVSSSVNGVRSIIHTGSNRQCANRVSPPTQYDTLPISTTLVHSQSSPRVTTTPILARASPLFQYQQLAGNSKGGY
ncbi:Enhancer of polycomb-like protein 1 [Termitomyces sp. J132]|nr:Enhancer of polycomb-like protein 1 [Termitomyces sp. J132]